MNPDKIVKATALTTANTSIFFSSLFIESIFLLLVHSPKGMLVIFVLCSLLSFGAIVSQIIATIKYNEYRFTSKALVIMFLSSFLSFIAICFGVFFMITSVTEFVTNGIDSIIEFFTNQ